MSGGHWNYMSYKLQEGDVSYRAVALMLRWLAVLERNADRAICGDDCSACYHLRAGQFVIDMFEAAFGDGGEPDEAAWDAMPCCERCRPFMAAKAAEPPA